MPCNQSPCWHVIPEGLTLRARVLPKKTARRIMTMTFRLLLTAVVLATTPPVWAAPASDGYCADAVDFAMRTAERRVAGKTQDSILQSIRESPQVFKQQYPDLEENDMREMVLQVFKIGRAHV